MPPHPQSHDAPRSLRGIPAALFRMLLPHAEREEVLQDLTAEHAARAARDGTLAARIWLWRQLLGSLPALGRRVWWRGWTGFEPRASRLHSGGHMLESWIMDVRYSARRLVSRPSFAVLAVVTLALGAGGTAAIFSVVRTLLLDPLPVARESEIGVLWMPGDWNEEEFLYLRPGLRGFQNMAANRPLDARDELRVGTEAHRPGPRERHLDVRGDPRGAR